jgi:hypothetical protein
MTAPLPSSRPVKIRFHDHRGGREQVTERRADGRQQQRAAPAEAVRQRAQHRAADQQAQWIDHQRNAQQQLGRQAEEAVQAVNAAVGKQRRQHRVGQRGTDRRQQGQSAQRGDKKTRVHGSLEE